MQQRKKTMLWGGMSATLFALLAYATFWIMGSAVVIDRSGQITSAMVTTGGDKPRVQPMYALPFGAFYTVPRLEGTITVRCRDGSQAQWGYVTGRMHTWLRLEAGQACGMIKEVS